MAQWVTYGLSYPKAKSLPATPAGLHMTLAPSMPLSVRRLLASTINVLITVILSRPLVACGANHETAVIAVFLVYNLVCEMALGRCLGGTVAGIHWVNAPSLLRRVGFCFLYTLAFVPYVVFPLWQIVPNVTVQWLWGHYVGGTIHSWLAGVQST